MQEWIVQMMDRFGYLGIALLIAVENIFPPIPSEVILTFGGFMTTYTSMNVWLVILFSSVGSVAGALILYGVGRLLKPERLERWLSGKLGRMLHLKPEDIEKANGWFQRKGTLTVFFCRFIPIVRSLISIPAGISKMNMGMFLLLTTAGTVIWNSVLVFLGVVFGSAWENIAGAMDIYSKVALVLLGVAFLIICYVFYKKRIAPKKAP